MSSAPVTLSTFPFDIVRLILQIDEGVSARNLKMISRSWHLLANEYLNNHPHVEWLQLDATFKQELSVGIKLLPVHFKHFEKILQTFTRRATDEKQLVFLSNDPIWTQSRFSVQLSLKALEEIVAKIKRIDHLILKGFKEFTLQIVQDQMKQIKIRKLEVTTNQRECWVPVHQLIKMARLHRIEEIGIYIDLGRGRHLISSLKNIFEFVPVIHLRNPCLPHSPHSCKIREVFGISELDWTQFANSIIRKSSGRKFSIVIECSCSTLKKPCESPNS